MQLALHLDDGAAGQGVLRRSGAWPPRCESAVASGDAADLQRVQARLQAAYGALAPWRRRDPVSQLVRSLIAARTQDAVSDAVLARLRDRFGDWAELARARADEVLAVIGPVTYPERKAEHLPKALRGVIARAGALRLDWLNEPPLEDAMAWLQALPGVGQKTAASVLNFSLGRRVMVVDGHVLRVAARLGLAASSTDAGAAREALMQAAPDGWGADDLLDLHRRLKWLGQTACRPHGPDCGSCPLGGDCPDAARRRRGSAKASSAAPERNITRTNTLPEVWGRHRSASGALDAQASAAAPTLGSSTSASLPVSTLGVLTPGTLTLGARGLDAAFDAGGLPAGLHQVAPETPGDLGALLLLAVAAAARLPPARDPDAMRLLLAAERDALREGGCVHGPGLEALGAPMGRTAFVRAPDGAAALRLVEAAIRLKAAPVMAVELRRGEALADLSATRRLGLLARRAGVFVFLLTPTLEATGAAITRWKVGSRPSRGRRRRLGAPAFALHLVRNRRGRTGEWSARWSAHERGFTHVAPLSAPVGAPVVDRPRAPGADAVAAAA